MQKIIFTNSRGESLEIGNSQPFILSHIDGTGGAYADIQSSRAPYQDGSTLHDVILNDRSITIEGAIIGSSREDMYIKRQLLSRVFNPKLGTGSLQYINDNGVKKIPVVVEKAPAPNDRYANNQLFTINLLCNMPFWLDDYKTSVKMAYQMGGLTFPLKLPTKFAETTFKRTVINSGDVSTPVEIEFYGSAINPTVMNNTTGEFITVKRTLLETDKLIISTEFGNKRVEIETAGGARTNVFNWIDLESTFFQLQVGANELQYDSHNDDVRSKVMVYYYNRYVGV